MFTNVIDGESFQSLFTESMLGKTISEESTHGYETLSSQGCAYHSFFKESIINLFLSNKLDVIKDEKHSFSTQELFDYYKETQSQLQEHTSQNARVGVVFHPSAAQGATILAIIASGRVPVIYSHWKTQKEIQLLSSRDHLEGMFTSDLNDSDDFNSECSIWFVNRKIKIQRASYYDKNDMLKRNLQTPVPGTSLILFTSGSSGEPKTVPISAKALVYTVSTLIDYLHLNNQTQAMITLPLFHTMALNTQFLPTLLAGGSCSVLTPELSVGSTYKEISHSKSTFISTIADMIPFLAKEKEMKNIDHATEVKDVQLAGGVISEANLKLTKSLFPNARIHKGYGQTELIRTTMISCEDPNFYTSTIGKPLKGQIIQIRDDNGESHLGCGEVGKLFVHSPSQTLGYEGGASSHDPCADPFWDTGDYACIDENGYLYFHGRKDSVFKSQGKKISGLEIEKTALKTEISPILKCFAIKCNKKGLKPILVLEKQKAECDNFFQQEINVFENTLRDSLPAYKVPKEIFLKTHFERLPNGKIDMKLLEHKIHKKDFVRIGKAKMGMTFFQIIGSELS